MTMKVTKGDERLRRESPAYQPDADWDELEPQGMHVVMSVRFDARSARRIADLACETGRSPGGVVRDWTRERLASVGAGLELRAATGVREASANYEPDIARYEEERQHYRPDRIDILLVGESRPAGGTFFYLANSNLYYATHEAFQAALGPMPASEEFLRYLQQRGVWLYDLADTPVDRLPGRPRREAVQGRIGELVALLAETKPRLVVAIKKDLAATVRLALAEVDLSTDRLRVLPFPLYQWRAVYVRELARLLSDGPLPDRAASSKIRKPKLHQEEDPMGDGRTQRVTEKDIAGGRIRIPAAQKALLPDERGELDVDLRGHRMSARYDPRNGPDRPRSGVFSIPRSILADLVEPDEVLNFTRTNESVLIR